MSVIVPCYSLIALNLQNQLEETTQLLEQAKATIKTQAVNSPEIKLELERALEQIKDIKESNTSLQLQLDTVNKSHQNLKVTHEEVLSSNKSLERRLSEAEALLVKYKAEVVNVQKHRDKLLDNETELSKQLELEKMQTKNLKAQTEKDAKCILDLNRQIKEMERIIARKHPDSVSALIVASKNDFGDSNLSARKVRLPFVSLLRFAISVPTNTKTVFALSLMIFQVVFSMLLEVQQINQKRYGT